MANDPLPILDPISASMDRLKGYLRMVGKELVNSNDSSGRVLAQDIQAFRDSPSTDVSAMDGYAVQLRDVDGRALPVTGISTAGSSPLRLESNSAIRVFTGGPVPEQADCVVRREDCVESATEVSIQVPNGSIPNGLNIRKQGENARKGDIVIQKGVLLSACQYAGALTFQAEPQLEVFQKVRVCIVNTGDELIEFGKPIESWQIRDSNGPFLETSLAKHPWIATERFKVSDHREKTEQVIRDALERCDVLLLTGGVSMGDTDYVPDSIRSSGGQVVFHKIPIRPGRPMLGAYGPQGQLILGLPGNPLSVAVTFRRYAMELIRQVAGFVKSEFIPSMILETNDTKAINLTWFRLVSYNDNGQLQLVTSLGSGDIASLIRSDGFMEIPPNCIAAGTRKFYAW